MGIRLQSDILYPMPLDEAPRTEFTQVLHSARGRNPDGAKNSSQAVSFAAVGDKKPNSGATAELRKLVHAVRDNPSGLTGSEITRRVGELKAQGADFSAGLFGGDADQDLGLLVAAGILEKPDLFNAMLEAIPEADRADALNKEWGQEGITAMLSVAVQEDSDRYKAAKAAGGKDNIKNSKGYTPADIAAEHRKRGLPLLAAISLGGALTLVGWGVVAAMGIGMLAAWYFSSSSSSRPTEGAEETNPEKDIDIGDDLYNNDENKVVKEIKGGAVADGEYPGDISYLLYAAATGQTDAAIAIADELAEEGLLKAALNHKGPNDLTPLLAAGFDGNRTLYKYFLKQGADASQKDSIYGYTASDALDVAEGGLEKRGIDNAPYKPTRPGSNDRSRSIRRWIQRIVARYRSDDSEGPRVVRFTETRGRGRGSASIVPPDPNSVTDRAWIDGAEHNQANLDRVLTRAQELVDGINRELGTNYTLSHNFGLARDGMDRIPLYLSVGSFVIGSVPQDGFINQQTVNDTILAHGNLHWARQFGPNDGRSPRDLRGQSAYILVVLSSILNSARTTPGLRERFQRLMGRSITNFVVETGALMPHQSTDTRGYVAMYRSTLGNTYGMVEFNPFDRRGHTRDNFPFFGAFAHEMGHADQRSIVNGRFEPMYNLRPGDFDGQRRQIDGVPVVWRTTPRASRRYSAPYPAFVK